MAAFILWPIVRTLGDLAGRWGLDRFVAGGDFGVSVRVITLPLCFLLGLFIVVHWALAAPAVRRRILRCVVAVSLYLVWILAWSFEMPGRISRSF